MIDMKMPMCCIGCPILRNHYGQEAYCPFVCEENNINIKERIDRPSECPLKEIEESEDCVSRQAALSAAIEAVADYTGYYSSVCEEYIRKALEKLQPVTPAEKTGQWIKYVNNWVECSRCHELSCYKTNYCPNCGQPKMQEVKNDT